MRLAQDDDFASARSKLTGAVGRAALVIPADCPAMSRTLAFQMLRRWAHDNAVQLLIVTKNAPLQRLARELGFRVCSSPRQAEARWREDDALLGLPYWLGWLVRQRWRMVSWVVGAIAVALGAGWMTVNYLPLATVRLTPPTQSFTDQLEITVDPAATSVDAAHLVVPARLLNTKVEASDRVTTSGKKEEYARGLVTFANLTDSEVRVPQGTVVSSFAGKKYKTTVDAIVPRPRWSAVRVEVQAVDVAAKGETDRMTVNRVEGQLSSTVAVLNDQPIAIDKSRQTSLVTAADRDKLRASLLDRLNKQALASLNSQMKQGEIVAPQSLTLEVVQEEYDHAVGAETAQLSLRLGVTATAMIYDQRQVSDLARRSKEARAQGSQQVITDSLRVGQPQLLGARGAALVFKVSVEGQSIQPVDETVVRRLVAGRPPAEAAAALQRNFGLVRPPEVTIEPAWATQAQRVTVVIESASRAP
ncbi:MAG: hypothetical protein ACYC4L_03730 [Chloroflexota bacterium]